VSTSLTLPSAGRAAGLRARLLPLAGAAIIAATYLMLVLFQPAEAAAGLGSWQAITAFAGYLAGALLLLAGVLPQLPAPVVAVIPVGLVLNIVLGQFVGSTLVPLYLDSIGTVLVGFLAGRSAGAATGVLGSLVWSLFNPTVLPFAAGAAVIGLLAGTAARLGALRPYVAVVAGAVTGIIAGVISAPVAAFVYGGTSGAATGAIVAMFRAMGDSLLASVTKQALISDPADKAVAFLVAALLVLALPRRIRLQFPLPARDAARRAQG
jgi:energy-coupling factor transport system substrate-specific component